MEKIFEKRWQMTLIKVIAFFSSAQLFCMSVVVSVKGKRASSAEAPIVICAPHSTIVDSWVAFSIACRVQRVTPIVSAEFATVMQGGALMMACNPITVNKLHPRQLVMETIVKRVTAAGDYPQIFISPEGTCTNRKSLLKFKEGTI